MKAEIRGLKAGKYRSKDDSLLLSLSKSDNGVVIGILDTDADIFYAVTVDENGKPSFEWGSITSTMIDDNKGDSDVES